MSINVMKTNTPAEIDTSVKPLGLSFAKGFSSHMYFFAPDPLNPKFALLAKYIKCLTY